MGGLGDRLDQQNKAEVTLHDFGGKVLIGHALVTWLFVQVLILSTQPLGCSKGPCGKEPRVPALRTG